MIDGVAGKLPINQAAKERHIVYYQLISVSYFELVKALSHNFALSCKQIEVYYHTNNNSTDAYGWNIFNNLRQKLQVYRSKLERFQSPETVSSAKGTILPSSWNLALKLNRMRGLQPPALLIIG